MRLKTRHGKPSKLLKLTTAYLKILEKLKVLLCLQVWGNNYYKPGGSTQCKIFLLSTIVSQVSGGSELILSQIGIELLKQKQGFY